MMNLDYIVITSVLSLISVSYFLILRNMHKQLKEYELREKEEEQDNDIK